MIHSHQWHQEGLLAKIVSVLVVKTCHTSVKRHLKSFVVFIPSFMSNQSTWPIQWNRNDQIKHKENRSNRETWRQASVTQTTDNSNYSVRTVSHKLVNIHWQLHITLLTLGSPVLSNLYVKLSFLLYPKNNLMYLIWCAHNLFNQLTLYLDHSATAYTHVQYVLNNVIFTGRAFIINIDVVLTVVFDVCSMFVPYGLSVDDHDNVWTTDIALHQVCCLGFHYSVCCSSSQCLLSFVYLS